MREDHLAAMPTRDLLLVQGIRMFHKLGVNGTGIGQVLKATRKSKSQFYHYFQDKDDYICCILRLEMEIMLRMASRRALTRVEDFREWFSPYIELGELPDHMGCPVGAIASELSPSHPSVRKEASDQLLRWESFMAGCLEELGLQEGFPADYDPKFLGQQLAAAIQGALLMGRATQDLRFINSVRDDYERLLRGYRKSVPATAL